MVAPQERFLNGKRWPCNKIAAFSTLIIPPPHRWTTMLGFPVPNGLDFSWKICSLGSKKQHYYTNPRAALRFATAANSWNTKGNRRAQGFYTVSKNRP